MKEKDTGFVIAVVDDDRAMLESLKSLLESAEFSVLAFASAKALFESGYLATVDFLISDIDMPVIDGFELLRMARVERPELPVILITGLVELQDRLPAIGTGNYLVFKKPFDAEALLLAVQDGLRGPLGRPARS